MKLISARQSWHDAFYAQADSTMEAAREILIAGISKSTGYGLSGGWLKTKPTKNDNGVYRDDSSKLLHRAIAGRVQLAISHLPKSHSRFGMMMYAPHDFITVEDVESSLEYVSARVAAYFMLIEKPLSHKKFSALPYIARAMLCRFRALVSGQRDPFKGDTDQFSNKKLRDFIKDECGVSLARESFWREYGPAIERITSEIDQLDKQCLVPVAKVVARYKENETLRSEESWRVLFTAQFWDECFGEIKQYCEGLSA